MKRILNLIVAIVLVAVAMTVVAFAAVDENHAEMELNLTPVDGQTDIYELTATCSAMSTMQSIELTFTYDKTVFAPVNATTYKNIAAAALRKQAIAMVNDPTIDWPFTLQISNFTDDGNKTKLQIVCTADMDVRDYYSYTDFTIFKVAFKVTADDVSALTSDEFYVNQVFMSVQNDTEGVENHRYGYNYEVEVEGTVDLINNVAAEPEAAVITIPVAAGDKIYLQDGTVATAEVAGDYEVPAEVGYVAVNSGKYILDAKGDVDENAVYQKTYYVDGTTATEVHVNGAVSSDILSLRDRTPVYDKDKDVTEDRNGIRFQMGHNPASRAVENHEVTEVGFIMTAETKKVISAVGENYVLNMELVENHLAVSGVAYGNGRNTALDQDQDRFWLIGATMYGIPVSETGVQTKIVSRPYYKVGDAYIYGEVTATTLYDIAKNLKEYKYDECEDSLKDYIDEIIFQAEGTEVVEDEVIIDISGLYNKN